MWLDTPPYVLTLTTHTQLPHGDERGLGSAVLTLGSASALYSFAHQLASTAVRVCTASFACGAQTILVLDLRVPDEQLLMLACGNRSRRPCL